MSGYTENRGIFSSIAAGPTKGEGFRYQLKLIISEYLYNLLFVDDAEKLSSFSKEYLVYLKGDYVESDLAMIVNIIRWAAQN
jgi:hypothetical protein